MRNATSWQGCAGAERNCRTQWSEFPQFCSDRAKGGVGADIGTGHSLTSRVASGIRGAVHALESDAGSWSVGSRRVLRGRAVWGRRDPHWGDVFVVVIRQASSIGGAPRYVHCARAVSLPARLRRRRLTTPLWTSVRRALPVRPARIPQVPSCPGDRSARIPFRRGQQRTGLPDRSA